MENILEGNVVKRPNFVSELNEVYLADHQSDFFFLVLLILQLLYIVCNKEASNNFVFSLSIFEFCLCEINMFQCFGFGFWFFFFISFVFTYTKLLIKVKNFFYNIAFVKNIYFQSFFKISFIILEDLLWVSKLKTIYRLFPFLNPFDLTTFNLITHELL